MSKFQPYGHKRALVKREIQARLDAMGKNFADIALLAGVSKAAVSATMNGFRHSPRVLETLRELGIPEKMLFDPHKDN